MPSPWRSPVTLPPGCCDWGPGNPLGFRVYYISCLVAAVSSSTRRSETALALKKIRLLIRKDGIFPDFAHFHTVHCGNPIAAASSRVVKIFSMTNLPPFFSRCSRVTLVITVSANSYIGKYKLPISNLYLPYHMLLQITRGHYG